MSEDSRVEYQLIRSRRKSLALEIQAGGRVLVRAPLHLANREIDRFLHRHSDWIKKHLAKTRVVAAEPTPEMEVRLRAKASELLPVLVARYASLLNVYPAYVRVTSARKRFGSCNIKGGLCFSWRLMRYPQPAIEYVVAHELAHLKQLNHSPAFYQLIAAVMPDFKQRAALLKQPPLDNTTL